MGKILVLLGYTSKLAIISLTIFQIYLLIKPSKLRLNVPVIDHYVVGVELKILPDSNKTVLLDLTRLFCSKPLDDDPRRTSSNKSGPHIGRRRKLSRQKSTTIDESAERKFKNELVDDDFTNLIHLDKCLQNRRPYCFCMDEGILIAATMAVIGVTLMFSMSDIRKLFSCAYSKPKTLDNELQPPPTTTTSDPPRNFTFCHLPHGCGYFMFSIVLWILWLVLGWVYYARMVVNWPFRLRILDTEQNPAFFDFYKISRHWKFIIIDCFVIATVILIDGAFQFTLSRPSADYESTSTTEADKQASSDPSQKSG